MPSFFWIFYWLIVEQIEAFQRSGIQLENGVFGALVHYVALTRLQSSSAGVSLGPLRVLNNASYSLSRELISSKLSNQHWRALKGSWVQADWRGGVIQKDIFDLSMKMSFYIQNIQNWATTTKVTWAPGQKLMWFTYFAAAS